VLIGKLTAIIFQCIDWVESGGRSEREEPGCRSHSQCGGPPRKSRLALGASQAPQACSQEGKPPN